MRFRPHTLILSLALCFGACTCDAPDGSNNGEPDTGQATDTGESTDTAQDVTATPDEGMPGGDTGEPFPDMGEPDMPPPADEYCSGEGPPLLQMRDGEVVCTGEHAAVSFRHAICACEDFRTLASIFTDSFDSAMGPYQEASAGDGASIGVNAPLTHSGNGEIGGSLWVIGDVSFTSDHTIAGELKIDGDFTGTGALNVGLDSYVTGRVTTTGDVNVAGTHHQPEGQSFSAGNNTDGVDIVREPVTVSPSCDCAEDRRLDIAAIVDAARFRRSGGVGLGQSALTDVEEETTIALPCGRYYLDEISGSAPITITVEGRVALFVAGDVNTTGDLNIEVADGGELDMFVVGTFTTEGAFSFGSIERPASARLYVGGEGEMLWYLEEVTWGGNLYAPATTLVLRRELDVYGSMFVRYFDGRNNTTVHYDSAVLRAGDGCDLAAPEACTSCRDCFNQACNIGSCGGCESNDDCCAPLLCLDGQCGVE